MKPYRKIDSSEPAYLRLYKRMRDEIVRGTYTFGEKLPSKRVTAAENGLSTVTVEHAYALLCDEGYAEARQRSGYIVVFRSEDGFVPVFEERSRPAFTVARADEPDAFPFTVLTRTMRAVITEYGEKILGTSPNMGNAELRHALSRYLEKSRGIKASPEQIVIGSGSEYLYGLIVGLLGRDRVYAIESPSYRMIEQVYLASGAAYEKLPLCAGGIDSSALRASRADVLHITPYRSFPSGITATASKRHEYLRWAEAPGRYLVEDDFESEFSVLTKPEETLFSLAKAENILYLNTFTRTISPSLRIGYLILPKHLIADYQKQYGAYACTVSTYMQLVLARLITSGDFERHINRVRRRKRKPL